MILGNFKDDLNQYVAENRGRLRASKASTDALNLIGSNAKGPLEYGKMYAFRYFTDDESFYDTYPIVLGLGNANTYNHNQLGLNLHYIPYRSRKALLLNITRSFSSIIESQSKNIGEPSKQMYLRDFRYDNIIKTLGMKYNIKYAVRQYRIDRMIKPRVLGYESWYIGAVNDDDFFYGGTLRLAQSLYYKNI